MAGSFFKSATRQITDISEFLKSAASGAGIKYSAEKGKKHQIYFPARLVKKIDENGNEVTVYEPYAISGDVHEWSDSKGGYHTCGCLKGIVIKDDNGNLINDGGCPYCDRIQDAQNIVNYRIDMEEMTCQLTGEQRKKHLDECKKTYLEERKIKKPTTYMYTLIVKFKTDDNLNPTMDEDGLPAFELKVMRLSPSRLEKINQTLANSGASMIGSEVIFGYPDVDDKRQQVSQCTYSIVLESKQFTKNYPGVLEKINEEAEKFDFSQIDKAFREWEGNTVQAAKDEMDRDFRDWDAYLEEKKRDSNARYLEYISEIRTQAPQMNPQLSAMATPSIPQQIGGMAMPQAGMTMPQAGMAMPQAGMMNQNMMGVPQATVPQVGVPQAGVGVDMEQLAQNQTAESASEQQVANATPQGDVAVNADAALQGGYHI